MTCLRFIVLLPLLLGCGARSPVSDGGLRQCPAAGGEHCFLLTPAESGLAGEGADVDQYALRPPTGARGQLLVFLNGSGGAPLAGAAGLEHSWYGVARAEGLHVLGVSYRSGAAVATLCQGDDACFEPTRVSQVTGVLQPGAASALSGLLADEGIEVRLVAALRGLAQRDPDGGWGDFLDSPDGGATEVRWERLFVSGHSQGGGHAALLGKRHLVARVLMLASPCDALSDGQLASWLSDATGWVTPPSTRYFGLWAQGDGTCAAAPAAWERLGMPDAARDVSADVCAGQAPHSAPLTCVTNEARWRAMLR
ncbi:MAG: hypothetical protein Q8L48_26505 [Archangium sp.]|nr:hypothetical protein [Archangium sp.]